MRHDKVFGNPPTEAIVSDIFSPDGIFAYAAYIVLFCTLYLENLTVVIAVIYFAVFDRKNATHCSLDACKYFIAASQFYSSAVLFSMMLCLKHRRLNRHHKAVFAARRSGSF